MQIVLGNTPVILLPQKALFLPEQSILVIADLHLGKAMHFRKAGIFMPQSSARRDYEVLHQLMEQYRPAEVWFLGDLFHSVHNSDWLLFESFIKAHEQVRFTLIRGNHDILKEAYYDQLQIKVVPHRIELDDLIFSHEPMETVAEEKINIAGHIHPGYSMRGIGRQSLRLPCFYLHNRLLLLPAFGELTGLYMMDRVKGAAVFAVLPERIVLL